MPTFKIAVVGGTPHLIRQIEGAFDDGPYRLSHASDMKHFKGYLNNGSKPDVVIINPQPTKDLHLDSVVGSVIKQYGVEMPMLVIGSRSSEGRLLETMRYDGFRISSMRNPVNYSDLENTVHDLCISRASDNDMVLSKSDFLNNIGKMTLYEIIYTCLDPYNESDDFTPKELSLISSHVADRLESGRKVLHTTVNSIVETLYKRKYTDLGSSLSGTPIINARQYLDFVVDNLPSEYAGHIANYTRSIPKKSKSWDLQVFIGDMLNVGNLSRPKRAKYADLFKNIENHDVDMVGYAINIGNIASILSRQKLMSSAIPKTIYKIAKSETGRELFNPDEISWGFRNHVRQFAMSHDPFGIRIVSYDRRHVDELYSSLRSQFACRNDYTIIQEDEAYNVDVNGGERSKTRFFVMKTGMVDPIEIRLCCFAELLYEEFVADFAHFRYKATRPHYKGRSWSDEQAAYYERRFSELMKRSEERCRLL